MAGSLEAGSIRYTPFVVRDPFSGEKFLRVVGRREQPPIGALPSAEARRALATMARYQTAAPKGVFIYATHEEMDRDRMRWTVDAMVARARRG